MAKIKEAGDRAHCDIINMMDICSGCGTQVSPEINFCPQCGKKFREPPPSKSVGVQAAVYAASLLAPPFGLWYAYKYFKYGDAARHKIGWVAVILTVISTGFAVWSAEIFVNSLKQSLQGLVF